MLRAIDRPLWWLLLLCIPLLDVIIVFVIATELAQRFGKGRLFAFGLTLLPFIFFPILGFGNAQYRGYVRETYEA